MRIAARRAVVVAAIIPVLALSAACSSGDSGKKDKSKGADSGNSADKDPAESSSSPSADEDVASGATLTKEQLEKAALTSEDLGKGYKVSQVPAKQEMNGDVLTADKPECQPVADVLSAEPKYKRAATVNRNALQGDFTSGSGSLAFTYLASYKVGDAEKSFSELKKALGTCESFAVKGQKETLAVKEVKAPEVGDEAVAFTFTDPKTADGQMMINVLRVGTTQASFAGLDLTGKKPSVPEAIVTKQAEKLQAVAPKG